MDPRKCESASERLGLSYLVNNDSDTSTSGTCLSCYLGCNPNGVRIYGERPLFSTPICQLKGKYPLTKLLFWGSHYISQLLDEISYHIIIQLAPGVPIVQFIIIVWMENADMVPVSNNGIGATFIWGTCNFNCSILEHSTELYWH